jgi:hypothetical protein
MQNDNLAVSSRVGGNGNTELLASSPSKVRSEELISLATAMLDALERVGYGAVLLNEREYVSRINSRGCPGDC